jgi:hypothetical protein
MVLVAGTTYRITRVQSGVYDAIRIIDDVFVGRFQSGPPLEIVEVREISESVLRDVAKAAVQTAKTSWVGRLQLQ